MWWNAMDERRRFPRRDNTIWPVYVRQAYRLRLLVPGPVMLWGEVSAPGANDPWGDAR